MSEKEESFAVLKVIYDRAYKKLVTQFQDFESTEVLEGIFKDLGFEKSVDEVSIPLIKGLVNTWKRFEEGGKVSPEHIPESILSIKVLLLELDMSIQIMESHLDPEAPLLDFIPDKIYNDGSLENTPKNLQRLYTNMEIMAKMLNILEEL